MSFDTSTNANVQDVELVAFEKCVSISKILNNLAFIVLLKSKELLTYGNKMLIYK